jgi:glutamine---fructose-6-phosphate transaminase (isomerizing)
MSLEREIHEQPAVLARLLETQADAIRSIAARVRERNVGSVFLAARGTSDNAGLYAKYVWGAHNGLPIALAAPSLFSVYKRPPRVGNSLVVGISQSGQSPDIVAVLEEGRRQGAQTLAIVNAPGSPLALAAESVVDIGAGDEKAVAATKTYTAQLMAVAMLSAAIADDRERWSELARVPAAVQQVLEQTGEIAARAERYRFMHHCVVLGRGFNYATAFEWALKLKELTYVVAEPYSSADFQHGPMALLERGFPVLAAAPSGVVFDDTVGLLRRMVADRHVELLVVSDRDEALSIAHTPIRLPSGVAEWLTPIVAVVAAQLFCLHLTRAKGLDTEAPRGLNKVTLTH